MTDQLDTAAMRVQMHALTFPRSARYGLRRVATMYADWQDLTRAMSAGDMVAAQDAFDRCQESIDWCFGMAAARGKEG